MLVRWSQFDAWCAERNIDPIALPYHRLLNLAYRAATSERDPEQRQEFDQMLAEANITYAQALAPGNPDPDAPPAWWDEDDYERETLRLARAHGGG